MAFSNGIITAPVSIDDVKQALGVGSNDLGTLCKSDKINKWSKIKPIRHSKKNGMTDSDYTTHFCGMDAPVSTSLPLLDIYMGMKVAGTFSNWIHLIPRGLDENEPYRLEDFLRYDTKVPAFAKSGFKKGTVEKFNLFTIEDKKLKIAFSPQVEYTNGVLIEDLFPDPYFYVEVYRDTETEWVSATPTLKGTYMASKPMSDSSAYWSEKCSITIDLTGDSSFLDYRWSFIMGFKSGDSRILIPYDDDNFCMKTYDIFSHMDEWIVTWNKLNTSTNSANWLDIPSVQSSSYAASTGSLYTLFKWNQQSSSTTDISNWRFKVEVMSSSETRVTYGRLINSSFQFIQTQVIPTGTGQSDVYISFPAALPAGSINSIAIYTSNDGGASWNILDVKTFNSFTNAYG